MNNTLKARRHVTIQDRTQAACNHYNVSFLCITFAIKWNYVLIRTITQLFNNVHFDLREGILGTILSPS